MVSIYFAAALCLGGLSIAQTTTATSATSTPTCGLVGYDEGSELAYYADSATALYSSYAACNTQCNSDTACLSFAIDPSVACILYSVAADSNVLLSSGSPYTFFDRGGTCPTVATSSTSTGPVATPTCSGFVGYDAGGTNIGFYADPSSATYSGCLALCDANAECKSFSITSQPACILYNYTVEGNDVSSPGSGNTFYDAGGACPSTTVTAATSTVTTPVQTGAFANCPSDLVPYNVNTGQTPYSPCNSSYPYSACMADVNGFSTYCNLCNACTNTTCTADSDCGAGYACISNSSCPVTGEATGTPVCLYMLGGGVAYGCEDALELKRSTHLY